MKYLFSLFLSTALIFTSCSTSKSSLNSQPIKIQEFQRDEYVVLDKVHGEAKSLRIWLLFIPFGGKSDQALYEQAYQNAVKSAVQHEADGLLQPHYTYKKTSVPLILFGITTKKATAEGRAFKIKDEVEYQNSKIKINP